MINAHSTKSCAKPFSKLRVQHKTETHLCLLSTYCRMIRGFQLELSLSNLTKRFCAFVLWFQKSLIDSPLLLRTTLDCCANIDNSCLYYCTRSHFDAECIAIAGYEI